MDPLEDEVFEEPEELVDARLDMEEHYDGTCNPEVCFYCYSEQKYWEKFFHV